MCVCVGSVCVHEWVLVFFYFMTGSESNFNDKERKGTLGRFGFAL